LLKNPFLMPPDEEVFRMREEEKRRKRDERELMKVPTPKPRISWVEDSQFARIRKLSGFARIRPGIARLLDIFP